MSQTTPGPDQDPEPHGTEPAEDLGPSPRFKAKIRELAEQFPYDPAQDEPPPSDDLAERRDAVYRQAWAESLHAAHVEDLADWQLSDLAPDQHPETLRGYVEHIGRNAKYLNLVLAGRVGPGKTSAAIAAGNHAAGRGLMVRFIEHATYLSWLRPDGTPDDIPDWQVRKRFRDCDLLILDDLGAGLDLGVPASRHVRDETTSLIGNRIDSPGKATIVTTNVRSEHLEKMIDDRLMSRLSKRGLVVEFSGPDRRGRLTW